MDVLKSSRLVYAGRSSLHTMDMPTTVVLKLLGKKYTYVPGYRSVTKIRTSLESKESNITSPSLGFYKNVTLPSSFHKNGDIKAVWYWPNMDPEAAKILRRALKMPIEDDITRAEERKVLDFAYDDIDHEAAKKTLARLANADPKFVKYWKDHIARGAKK